ncbi:unnamed protein product, partial [Meganyctiphanes norvegica]
RSGRGRKGRSGSPPSDLPPGPNHASDRGGKTTSPRAVHPSDLIVNPHSRRSLERGGGLNSPCSGKSPPTPTPGGGVLLPDSDSQHTPLHHSAYPITPNLVVTGGKIEFITPPG